MYATLLFDPTQLSLVSPVPLVAVPSHARRSQQRAVCNIGADSPLTVAACFEQLAVATDERMREHASRPLEVPREFAERLSTNGRFALRTQSWQLGTGASRLCLRMVKIDGAKSNIINTWIFPADARHLPVFAAELIGVGDTVRVAFVDVQLPVASAADVRLTQQLAMLASKYAHLPSDEAAPDWATDASSGHYTYARNVGDSQLHAIGACYLDYLDRYLDHVHSVKVRGNSAPIDTARETLHAYQLHHMQHSPGKKFLGNLFGIEWTDQFMLDFLFTLP